MQLDGPQAKHGSYWFSSSSANTMFSKHQLLYSLIYIGKTNLSIFDLIFLHACQLHLSSIKSIIYKHSVTSCFVEFQFLQSANKVVYCSFGPFKRYPVVNNEVDSIHRMISITAIKMSLNTDIVVDCWKQRSCQRFHVGVFRQNCRTENCFPYFFGFLRVFHFEPNNTLPVVWKEFLKLICHSFTCVTWNFYLIWFTLKLYMYAWTTFGIYSLLSKRTTEPI